MCSEMGEESLEVLVLGSIYKLIKILWYEAKLVVESQHFFVRGKSLRFEWTTGLPEKKNIPQGGGFLASSS